MKNLMIILTILLTSSTWARSFSECLDTECLRERATNFKAFLKVEENFTNELGKAFPNSTLDKLLTNFVDEIRVDFNNANIDRETTLSQMKNNIRDNGIHAAFVNPAIVFMDMYASLGKKDKVLSMANIVNALNPAIGDTLEKDFGIEIDRNYDPNFTQNKSPFGGPRMGHRDDQFSGDNGFSNDMPETIFSPRMGGGAGFNESDEMISPILAQKLKMDKQSLMYSVTSGREDVELCISTCGVVGGLGLIFAPKTLGTSLVVAGLICAASCLPTLKDAYKKQNKERKDKTNSNPSSPRGGGDGVDIPEVKPDTPEIDKGPRTGDDDQPKVDDGGKPEKGEGKPKKGDDKPEKGEDKPKKDEGEPKKGEGEPKKGECDGSQSCKDNDLDKMTGRTLQNDPSKFDDMLNLNERMKVNFKDLQVNFGRPQFRD